MLYWTVLFFVVAIVAGLFGFGGIASASVGIAKILFFVFIFLFLLSLIFGGVVVTAFVFRLPRVSTLFY